MSCSDCLDVRSFVCLFAWVCFVHLSIFCCIRKLLYDTAILWYHILNINKNNFIMMHHTSREYSNVSYVSCANIYVHKYMRELWIYSSCKCMCLFILNVLSFCFFLYYSYYSTAIVIATLCLTSQYSISIYL